MRSFAVRVCLVILLFVGAAPFNYAGAQGTVPAENVHSAVLVGKWRGEQVGTQGGTLDATYYFELRDGSLTGRSEYYRALAARNSTGTLSDIRFDGATLTFTVTYHTSTPRNNTRANYVLTLKGNDALEGKAKNQDTGNEFEVKLRKGR